MTIALKQRRIQKRSTPLIGHLSRGSDVTALHCLRRAHVLLRRRYRAVILYATAIPGYGIGALPRSWRFALRRIEYQTAYGIAALEPNPRSTSEFSSPPNLRPGHVTSHRIVSVIKLPIPRSESIEMLSDDDGLMTRGGNAGLTHYRRSIGLDEP
ncbi:hypothetical protein EVAR_95865_1 [Eumeta japonica]|uniref:Uncharacterized protein n=1 Tax=Eumeta variegata TaxID=151549 RepID=A0A4C1VLB0_EUMVA|nr:hypothetical protein EVAR_95865_1 [Eumeta japonica]